MEHVATILEREGDALEQLLFKLIETQLLLQADEARFLPRATREVERARARARELDLLRAATVARTSCGARLRDLATAATGPWPAILRDHHDVLSRLVDEIEVVAHQNAQMAERGIATLSREPVPVGAAVTARPIDATAAGAMVATATVAVAGTGRPIRNAELDRLARGAALDAVLGTAAKLRMPDLIDFLR
jgi:hypothetical protein